MNVEMAIDIMRNLLQITLLLISPILGTAVSVGLLVSLVQSVTSIQEQTLTFVPKLFAVGSTLVVSAHWMTIQLMEFCTQYLQRIPEMAP